MKNKRVLQYLDEEYGILTADNVLLLLGVHLLVVNAKILHDLSTKRFPEVIEWVLALFFAASYAYSTIYILRQSVPRILKVSFALLDGFLIFLWYFNVIAGFWFSVIGAATFAIFTVFITLSMGFLRYEKKKKEENVVEESVELVLLKTELAKKEYDNQLLIAKYNKVQTEMTLVSEAKIKELEKLKEAVPVISKHDKMIRIGFALYIKSMFNKTKDPDKRSIAEYMEKFITSCNGDVKALSDAVVKDYKDMLNFSDAETPQDERVPEIVLVGGEAK